MNYHSHSWFKTSMIAESTTASKQIIVNARLRGAPDGNIYAIIEDAMGNRYSKQFAHVADSKVQTIDFDSLPDGFLYPSREFRLWFAASLNDNEGFPIEMMRDAELLAVMVMDDASADGEPQTIGEIPIP